ncbi:MAG: hypothetical protein RLZZ628_3496 [Bacteroidota bacterium]
MLYEALKLKKTSAVEYLLKQTRIQGKIHQRCYAAGIASFQEDVVQETGMRVCEAIRLERYRYETHQTHPVSFAISVAGNVIREYVRKENKNKKINDMIPPEQNQDWLNKVKYAISQVSNSKYRQILELRILEGYEYEEIIQERLIEGVHGTLRNLYCKAKAELISIIRNLFDLDFSDDLELM